MSEPPVEPPEARTTFKPRCWRCDFIIKETTYRVVDQGYEHVYDCSAGSA